VDAAFLAEIERWRDLLARNFALRNPSLSVRDLNFAVQKTIDRLVFLRICEDRGTEDYARLLAVSNGANCYARLIEIFRRADERYNSGLFHFSNEKHQAEGPDTITLELLLDDRAVKDIIGHLYYPESPYEFSVLPADILGSVYERFLGKTIRLTDGHQAKIEEKPEVRKAGGVYYTPAYIVAHIVRNTLGRLLGGPDHPISLAAAAKLKVADIACGSGSFLIQAYQFLLDWHRDRYLADPEKFRKGKNPTLYPSRGGEWRLTSAEKKRILLANIHGVDIDASAVEVTKLSLLLKVLEGETDQIQQRDFLTERQRILPDLAANIRCGNSLIGPDFYDHTQMDLLDDGGTYIANTAYAIGSADKCLLGFLNSRLFWFLISHISIPFGVRAGEFRYRLIYQYMAKVPIRPIDFSSPSDVARHGRMVGLVERMLELVPKRRAEKNPQTGAQLDAQIAATDRQIDRLVYELYGLTDEEVRRVEGA